jgi:hypothetical protein
VDQTEPPGRFGDRVLAENEHGFVLEKWLIEAFRLSKAAVIGPYEVLPSRSGRVKEQIDGLIYHGWHCFLDKSKFHNEIVSFEPVALFHAQVEGRPSGTMGSSFPHQATRMRPSNS